jgi:hypothetical protein
VSGINRTVMTSHAIADVFWVHLGILSYFTSKKTNSAFSA